MDDESYFTLDGNEWQGKHYYSLNSKPVKENVMYSQRKKFPEKVLVWVAISEKGMSNPVFLKSKLAMNKDKYMKKCLPKVENFIEKYHKNDNVVFWPDLATSHYANDTENLMKKLKIPFIPKDHNPPNCPQLRPIEDFWANLKRKVYADNYQAKSADSLICRIRKVLKKIEISEFSGPMIRVPKNVRKANKYGLMKLVH